METKNGWDMGETMTKDEWYTHCIEAQARMMCRIVGIEPIDSLDGSSNWWIFSSRATEIVDSLFRAFPIGEKLSPEPDHTPSQSPEPQPSKDQ